MSYVVSIRRDHAPITVDDVRTVVAEDPELSVLADTSVAADVLNVVWHAPPDASAVALVLSAGVIEATTPSNAALRKMQQIAARLDAQLVGEGGEDLTGVDVPEAEASSRGAMGCFLAVVGLALAVALWFALR